MIGIAYEAGSFPEQAQNGREEERPDDRRVDQHGHRGADRDLLHVDQVREREGSHRDREEKGRGRDHPAAAHDALRDRPILGVGMPARLGDPLEQEDPIVGIGAADAGDAC